MNKKAFVNLGFILSGIILLIFIHKRSEPSHKHGPLNFHHGKSNIEKLHEWQFNRLKDPVSGKIPANIRQKELHFAATLPGANSLNMRSAKWVHRGPYHVGGRTRALAIDIADENTLIAGAISGGIWRSTDAGSNWTKITPPHELHNVTCIIQDKRTGKNNTWYYGTGELLGNSASAPGAYFYGNGIYKSTDNGLNWVPLPLTSSNTPHVFDSLWDFVWNLAIDFSENQKDEIYAATFGAIFRSEDGGNQWDRVLGRGSLYYLAYHSDVCTDSKGVVYASLSSDGVDKGIWRSPDGINWTSITPQNFPEVYQRIVMAIDPSNEDEVYFLAHTPGSGKLGIDSKGRKSWNSLWKYKYLRGNGGDSNGIWIDLSENLPASASWSFDDFNAQGGYNFVIAVKPDDPDVVFIGGTNIYRSTDAFSSKNNTTQIGGYAVGTQRPDWEVYENHHPDQHVFVFMPSNPDILLNANDGGIFRTDNCLASQVQWTSLNNGYLSTQLYSVSIDPHNTDDIVITGYQDNGNYFTNSASPTAPWVMTLNGDGSFSAIAKDKAFYLKSIQLGKMAKMKLDNQGNIEDFTRIDPIGGWDYLFINPFVMDPHNNDLVYLAEGGKLWRNDSIGKLPYLGNYDSISTGWFRFSDTLINRSITALALSEYPPNILYYGTNTKRIYRVENAHTGDPTHEHISKTLDLPSSGYVSCIAVHPDDANKFIVVYSNYNVYSLFYSDNAGMDYQKIAGNLEENDDGSGSGPSLRWASILPLDDGTLYLIATSTGLYACDSLNGTQTKWVQVAPDIIGNVVIEMLKTRRSDGLILVATHGNGLYSTKVSKIWDILSNNHSHTQNAFLCYPNPAYDNISIRFTEPNIDIHEIIVLDIHAKIHYSEKTKENNSSINTSGWKAGVYFIQINSGGKKYLQKLILQ